MYGTPSHLIIGFHGCDRTVGEKVLAGKYHLNESKNNYDWLGSGRYFWEGNCSRAFEWSKLLARRKPQLVKEPFAVGAIIDLGHCFNLLESEHLKLLKDGYERYAVLCRKAGTPIPENKTASQWKRSSASAS